MYIVYNFAAIYNFDGRQALYMISRLRGSEYFSENVTQTFVLDLIVVMGFYLIVLKLELIKNRTEIY